jgi:hypothetical protein
LKSMFRIMMIDRPVSSSERGEGGDCTPDTGASAFMGKLRKQSSAVLRIES